MNQIIETLIKAFNEPASLVKNNLLETLNLLMKEIGLSVISSLPISVVKQHSRIKSPEIKDEILTQGLYDDKGEAYITYRVDTLKQFVSSYSSLFQTIDIVIMDQNKINEVVFATKRPNDYWTRMTNTQTIRAMIKKTFLDSYTCTTSTINKELQESSNGQWSVESDLRDDMRSKKENPDLREKPYISLYIVDTVTLGEVKELKAMLEHYFGNCVIVENQEQIMLLGHSDTLDEISLREFYKKCF